MQRNRGSQDRWLDVAWRKGLIEGPADTKADVCDTLGATYDRYGEDSYGNH